MGVADLDVGSAVPVAYDTVNIEQRYAQCHRKHTFSAAIAATTFADGSRGGWLVLSQVL